MAKDEKQTKVAEEEKDEEKNSRFVEFSPANVSPLTAQMFTKFYPYVMKGKQYNGKDRSLIFYVKLSRDVQVNLTNAENRPVMITIPGNVSYKCSRVVFEQLFQKWIQEGPQGRIYEWDTPGLIDMTQKKPFDLEVVKTEYDSSDPSCYSEEKPIAPRP